MGWNAPPAISCRQCAIRADAGARPASRAGRGRSPRWPGRAAGGAEKALLMVAEDHQRLALAQDPYDVVGEPVFVNAVAEADEFVDIADNLEGAQQAGRVAMHV